MLQNKPYHLGLNKRERFFLNLQQIVRKWIWKYSCVYQLMENFADRCPKLDQPCSFCMNVAKRLRTSGEFSNAWNLYEHLKRRLGRTTC